jgi:hypothetical protein
LLFILEPLLPDLGFIAFSRASYSGHASSGERVSTSTVGEPGIRSLPKSAAPVIPSKKESVIMSKILDAAIEPSSRSAWWISVYHFFKPASWKLVLKILYIREFPTDPIRAARETLRA